MRHAALLVGLAVSACAPLRRVVAPARWSSIPTTITLNSLGDLPKDEIRLMSNCGAVVDDPTVPAVGSPIVRILTINGKAVEVTDTVKAADRQKRKDIEVSLDQSRSFSGTVFIDKTSPKRLRVNPWLQTKPTWLDCPPATTADSNLTPAQRLREAEFFYDLENRQTVFFRTRTRGYSGVTVPLRYRRGYTAKNTNRTEIASSVADPLNFGVQYTFSWSQLRYQYVRNVDTPLQESRRYGVGVMTLLGKATVNDKSSRSAETPVTTEASFLTLSIGPSATVNVRGIEVGLYAAPEFPLWGTDSGKWDFHSKWWFGVGLSFVPGLLGAVGK